MYLVQTVSRVICFPRRNKLYQPKDHWRSHLFGSEDVQDITLDIRVGACRQHQLPLAGTETHTFQNNASVAKGQRTPSPLGCSRIF